MTVEYLYIMLAMLLGSFAGTFLGVWMIYRVLSK